MQRRATRPGKPPSRRPIRHVNLDPERPSGHDAILGATLRQAGIKPGGGPVLVIGTRAGDAEHIPPGYALSPCIACAAQVWINGTILRDHDVIALCTDHAIGDTHEAVAIIIDNIE